MKIPLFQIDAFTDRRFHGNPAAVCPLSEWLEDEILQAIARENNLSETAFFVKEAEGVFRLRWFTPVAEVDLCGHATLASAYVIFTLFDKTGLDRVRFLTRSGELTVFGQGNLLTMDFPAHPPRPCRPHPALVEALGGQPREILAAGDYLVVYATENEILECRPDMRLLKEVDRRGVIITAPGEDIDFVSRFFAPKLGVDEDPVTGSAHCELTPYWAQRLQKQRLTAHQLSQRGGSLTCELVGDRVFLSGQAVKYLEGFIEI